MSSKASDNDRDMMPPPKRLKENPSNIEALPNVSIANGQQPLETVSIMEILYKAQTNECMYLKYFKELNEIYDQVGHEKFSSQFLKGLRVWMKFDQNNAYANAGLKFCAKYLATLANNIAMDTHPMLLSTFKFLLNNTSLVANVRFRICQFVNIILNSFDPEFGLEDYLCRDITKYMLNRLTDLSTTVRVQAIRAIQRLQQSDDPNDVIFQTYKFHMANDPSSAVRMAVISTIGCNYLTVPSIIDRLWDVDENVRRHTYVEMRAYPVKVYKVLQRITILEQGFNDKSDRVRKVVTSVLLPEWLHSYGGKYIELVAALKIDSNDNDLKRFVKVAKHSLFTLFKNKSFDKLLEQLPLAPDGSEFGNCVPFEKLTVEVAVYWVTLIEYYQSIDNQIDNDDDDTHENFICELGTFCDYLKKLYCLIDTKDLKHNNEWMTQENRYKAYILMDILLVLDLGDEIGRNKLKSLVTEVTSTKIVEEEIVKKMVLIMENLIHDSSDRLQFFVDLLRTSTDSSEFPIDLSKSSISGILSNISDPDLKMKITQLRLEILDLREQKMMKNQVKDYQKVHEINEKLTARSDELILMLHEIPSIDAQMYTSAKKMTMESTIQCLQICFYAVASKHTATLTPSMCQMYKDFVRIQTEAKVMAVRDWALKCDIAYSMLYDQLALDAYNRLMKQFNYHHNTCIWTTSIKGIFELIDKYGFEFFDQMEEHESDTRSKILILFELFLDKCFDVSIVKALVTGFCRLILSGHTQEFKILSKLLLIFFSPTCDPEINRILVIFFETLINRNIDQQKCLAAVLLHTLHDIWNAPEESPLRQIKPEEIVKFVTNSTMPANRTAFNIHNVLALMFLDTMTTHHDKQDVTKLLSKELLTLKVSTDGSLQEVYQTKTETLLSHLHRNLDTHAEKHIRKFQDIFVEKSNGSDIPYQHHVDDDIKFIC